MKPIKKRFTNLGNSKGIVIDKILLKESDINEHEEVELVCGKNKITIRTPKKESK